MEQNAGHQEVKARLFGPCFFAGTSEPVPELLTETEAVRYLRLDRIGIKNPGLTLRRYRERGLLRGTQVSKCVFYLRVELDRFLERITDANPR